MKMDINAKLVSKSLLKIFLHKLPRKLLTIIISQKLQLLRAGKEKKATEVKSLSSIKKKLAFQSQILITKRERERESERERERERESNCNHFHHL